MLLKKLGSFFVDILEVFLLAAGIFLITYLLILRPHKIKGMSMDPNFKDGEYLLTEKVTYYSKDPQRGDVVVFKPPISEDEFIKRIIGLPGETISIKSQKVYINGKELKEDYISVPTYDGNFLSEGKEYKIPSGKYVVLGDNRPRSSDSRSWGTISKKDITGKAFVIYLPIDKAGLLQKPKYNI